MLIRRAAALCAVFAVVSSHALGAQAGTGAPTYTAISAGGRHTCALGADGTAYCWGSNQSGQLGNSIQVINQELPAPVGTTQKFSAISAGGRHTCALATDGTAWCWGANGAGQLGTGTTAPSRLPVAVAGGLRFGTISATDQGTCALTSDGHAYCWGTPSGGRLGAGDSATGASPALVRGPLTFTDVAAGYAHTCAIAASGQGYCWGMNNAGQLGDGTERDMSDAPVPVVGESRFRAVSSGGAHSCAIGASGRIVCWGYGRSGELGSATELARETNNVSYQGTFTAVDAGYQHACALETGGVAWCWGNSEAGQVGDSTRVNRRAATAVRTDLRFRAISAGEFHTCAVAMDGAAYCWGNNIDGRLGIGHTMPAWVPTRVVPPSP